jgi:hypothetical protein
VNTSPFAQVGLGLSVRTTRFAILLLTLFSAITTVRAQSFSPPATYTVGDNPNFGVVGDFNRDGKPDLATSAAQSNDVAVLINKGDGTFQNAVFYHTDFNAEGITTADFNKDGFLDIAVANLNGGPFSAGNISILLGKGDGTFQSAVSYDSPTPGGLRTADFNGDGFPDLAATAYQTNSVAILLNKGNGTFAAATSYPVGIQPNDLAPADFNGDGFVDLVVAGYLGNVSILLGNGNGTFQSATTLTTPRTFGVSAGDLNGDGKQDFVMAADQDKALVFLGNGNGTFQNPIGYAGGEFETTSAPSLADFNGDGKVDIALVNANPGRSFSIFRGNGDGTFQPGINITARQNSWSSVTADFNRDGKSDLAILDNAFDVVDVRLNSPSARGMVLTPTATIPASNILVATFIDYDSSKTASSFTATINWGDGTSTSSGVVSANGSSGFNVNGTHTYAKEGTYAVSVQIADTLGNFASASSTATVADAPLTASGKTINAIQGVQLNPMVASFTDADPTGQVADFSATINWGDGTAPTSGTISINSGGGFNVNGSHTYTSTGSFSISVAIRDVGGSTASVNSSVTVSPPLIQLSQPNYTASEGDGSVQITVVRTGDSPTPTSVDFATSDGTASSKKDYTTAVGTITFNPGEASKTFTVLLTDNGFVDGSRTLTLTISNPTGAVLGLQTSSTLTIQDNDSSPKNPVDDATFFVRQHYHDFLNREPDQSGLQFWVAQITSCGNDVGCIEVKRINVSASFFLSIEFQETGYLVERTYKAALGDADGTSTQNGAHPLKVPAVRLSEFLHDTQEIGQGVVVLQGNWQQQLENNKQAFLAEFVQRSRFTAAFPTSMTMAEFVDKLNVNAGNPLSPSERDQLVNSGMTRAQILRAVAEDPDLNSAEFNRAFVLMQFFGYLRRNPNDPQDTDYTGYDFWLTKLNQFNGSYINAEMVKAFLSSIEYRQRFGP